MELVEQQPHLALVGMHGPPEKTGLALLESVREQPIKGWDVEIANELAVNAGVRYVNHNMAIAFPGSRLSKDYELWRPTEIRQLIRGRKTVLEIHDRPDAYGEYVATGGVYRTQLLGIVALLGIDTVLGQVRFPILGNYTCNHLTVELCRDDAGDSKRRVAENVARLRACMEAVSLNDVPSVSVKNFKYYDYAEEIRTPEATALGLDKTAMLQPFETIPPSILKLLHLPEDREYVVEYWKGVNSSPDATWFGGILRRRLPPMELSDPVTARASGHDITLSMT